MCAIIAARAVIAGVAVLVLVTDVGFGGAEPGMPTVGEPEMNHLLNPCTDIPDEWLIETGLDPSTEPDIVNATDLSSWRICGCNLELLGSYLHPLGRERSVEFHTQRACRSATA